MQTNHKENPAVGTAGPDEEKGGGLISIPIITDEAKRNEAIGATLARVYFFILSQSGGRNGG
jgi:hypothetical protein